MHDRTSQEAMRAAPRLGAGANASPRTLVVVTSQFPGPNETFIVREMSELRRRGFKLLIFSLWPRPTDVMDPDARALMPLVVYPPSLAIMFAEALRTVWRTPAAAWRAIRRGLRDVLAAARTPRLALKQAAVLPLALAYARHLPAEPCRLHAHFASVPTAVVRVLAALRASAYSFTAHAWDIYVGENRRQLPARIAGADLVVTCTAHNRDFLASLAEEPADARKITLCHHGLDLAEYAPSEEHAPDLIIGGASLVEKKGLHDLVSACARLHARGTAFRCVLIGEGPERSRLETQIKALGLEGQVHLTGRIAHAEVIRLLRQAAVVAHPSVVDRIGSMDGIPNLVIEAMAVETPVVATRLSGIPEVVVPECTGILIEPGDVEGLAAALARLLDEPAFARRLGMAGRSLVHEHFDQTRNGERLAALLL